MDKIVRSSDLIHSLPLKNANLRHYNDPILLAMLFLTVTRLLGAVEVDTFVSFVISRLLLELEGECCSMELYFLWFCMCDSGLDRGGVRDREVDHAGIVEVFREPTNESLTKLGLTSSLYN